MRQLFRKSVARRHSVLIALCFAFITGWGYSGAVNGASSDEAYKQQVESILLFARLSQWPEGAFAKSNGDFIIGVLGDDPVVPFIEQLNGKKASKRKIKVVRYSQAQDLTQPHLLYVSGSERAQLNPILAGLSGRPVMTVSDLEGFAESGGMFEFFTRDDKVRYKLNQDAAQSAAIQIGNPVVKYGEIVHTKASPEIVAEPIRLAILPAEDNNHFATGIARGLFLPFKSDANFKIASAADSNLAEQLNAHKLKISSAQEKQLWVPGHAHLFGVPQVETVKSVVEPHNVDGVLMYTANEDGMGAGGRGAVRVFLIDTNNGQVHHIDRRFTSDASKDISGLVRDMATGLARTHLATRTKPHPIRVAILPERHHMIWDVGNKSYFRKGLSIPFKENPDFSITAAADPELARELGVDTLKLEGSTKGRLWSNAGVHQHAEPKFEVIKKVVDGLGVRAVIMYSAPKNITGYEIKVFLIDIATGKRYEVGGQLDARADPSLRISGFVQQLLNNYSVDLGEGPMRVAILPAYNKSPHTGIDKGLFVPLRATGSITVTHSSDSSLAEQLGADTLKISESQRKRLWADSGVFQHSEPNVETVQEIVKSVGVRAVLMYSAPRPQIGKGEVRLFLIDVESGEVERADLDLGFDIPTADLAQDPELKGLANKVLRNYFARLTPVKS